VSETLSPADDRRPVVIVIVGRQRVGKTTVANTLVQFLRAHGGEIVVWNADKLNRTYSLSIFHQDALEPPSVDPEDVKSWLEDRFAHLIQHHYDAVLDIGGGDTPLARLVQEVPIVRTLERRGIRVVLVHVVGPEMADLDYLERFLAENLFTAEATLIVLNDGLVLSGRSANFAFTGVKQHPAFLNALQHGAEIVLMPKLACMSQVTDRGLTFTEAMNGVNKPGAAPLSFFDQERVATWWENELPQFFRSIPPLWLPTMPGSKLSDTKVINISSAPGGKKRSSTDG